jgi:phage baseplate assembly protein W
MTDIAHQFGSDLTTGPTGDIATASGPLLTQQRVLRRLLTNPGDYVWQPDYGAGLAAMVGQPADALRIRAVIRGQIFKEPAVARTPEPVIDVQSAPGGQSGTVAVAVRYADADTGQTQILSLTVGA